MTRPKVIHVSTDTNGGFYATIVVSRFPTAQVRLPDAADLPSDIRKAIQAWLDTAEGVQR